jgi:hypothetical protein
MYENKEGCMKIIISVVFILMFNCLWAQGVAPSDWGLQAYHMKDAHLGDINYYVTKKGIDQEKPLLFVVSGTRGLPTMLVVQSGDKSLQLGTIPPDQIQSFANQFHVAFIGKAGTPFCDTMMVEEINPYKNLEDYQPSAEYVQKCGMEWELQASSMVIDSLFRMLPTSKKIIAMGFSEGGLLVPRLASENKRITHLVSVVSTGLNQFYSSIINRRIDAATGAMTHQEAQDAVDSLFAVYEKIYRDPNSTDKWYDGHPYKRWGSFCNYIPLVNLIQLDIPILYINGSIDRSSPILQADYIKLEFIRLGKNNLTYKVLPGVEHSLYEVVKDEAGNEQAVSRRKEAFKIIADWIAVN